MTTHIEHKTATKTLRALVLRLSVLEGGTLAGGVAELAHAAFYAALAAVDPPQAARLHDAQERAAFTLSPLHGLAGTVQPGQSGWLRLTLLDETVFTAFAHHLLAGSRPSLRLGSVVCALTEALGAPGSDPWAGYTTLDTLTAQAQPADRWTLDFASPTAIRWGEADNRTRRVELFPQPRPAVAGLRSRWDRWTGEGWGRDFEEWVERNVVVSRIDRWQTQTVVFQKQRYVGGLGRLEMRLLDPSDLARAAHLDRLWRLAFYTGIGYKTTHGLGQVRLLAEGSRE